MALNTLANRIMKLLFNRVFLEHETGMHPENPKRLENFTHLPNETFPDGTPFLSLIHTSEYIQKVKESCTSGTYLDQDTKTSPGSFQAATQAVGATLKAAENGDFALVRPPGHHAYPDRASGFCLFNNVAITAEYYRRQGKKVLIMDFDGHLGDGTEAIFYDSNEVMYWSIHQYPAFPGHGFIDEIGDGDGKGFTLNSPLPPGSADDIFWDAFESLLPIARQFEPDIVAVSAGFDAHQYDLLLDLKVSNKVYYKIGKALIANFPRLFATLEGGYNVNVLEQGIHCFMAGVNNQPIPYEITETCSGLREWETYEINLNAVLGKLQPYWSIR